MYYLARKNEILEKQVRILEETLEEKNQRISELEGAIEERQDVLTKKASDGGEEIGQSNYTPTLSFWRRLRRLVGPRNE
ncbi:hypothetical protein ACFQMM_09780 [Saliphagus sp. GCM10025308]